MNIIRWQSSCLSLQLNHRSIVWGVLFQNYNNLTHRAHCTDCIATCRRSSMFFERTSNNSSSAANFAKHSSDFPANSSASGSFYKENKRQQPVASRSPSRHEASLDSPEINEVNMGQIRCLAFWWLIIYFDFIFAKKHAASRLIDCSCRFKTHYGINGVFWWWSFGFKKLHFSAEDAGGLTPLFEGQHSATF